MTFRRTCPFCEADLTVSAAEVGEKITCPKCGLSSLVKDRPAPTVETAEPTASSEGTEPGLSAPSARHRSPTAPSRLRVFAGVLVLTGFSGVSGFFLGRHSSRSETVVAEPAVVEPTAGHRQAATPSGSPLARGVELPVAPSPRPVIPVLEVAPEPRLAWRSVRFVSGTTAGGGRLELQPDGSLLARGPVADQEQYTIVLETDLPAVTALRLEALADPSLPGGGPGRAGNFVLNELRVAAEPIDAVGKPEAVRLVGPTATFSQDGCDVESAIDGALSTGWAIAPKVGQSHAAVFPFAAPSSGERGVRLTVTMDQCYGGRHVLGRFRFSVAP